PVKNEPPEVLEETIITLRQLDYPACTVYLLDNSDTPQFVEKNLALSRRYAIQYFRPAHLEGAKARTINEFISTMREPYLAVFDADQHPIPSFLKDIIPVIERDPRIAFIQTPQFYANASGSPITRAAAVQQYIFFEIISEAKGRNLTNSLETF
ncbi:MAG: glycosyltransferase, partial [Candidatus Saccharimonadales bacterium]